MAFKQAQPNKWLLRITELDIEVVKIRKHIWQVGYYPGPTSTHYTWNARVWKSTRFNIKGKRKQATEAAVQHLVNSRPELLSIDDMLILKEVLDGL